MGKRELQNHHEKVLRFREIQVASGWDPRWDKLEGEGMISGGAPSRAAAPDVEQMARMAHSSSEAKASTHEADTLATSLPCYRILSWPLENKTQMCLDLICVFPRSSDAEWCKGGAHFSRQTVHPHTWLVGHCTYIAGLTPSLWSQVAPALTATKLFTVVGTHFLLGQRLLPAWCCALIENRSTHLFEFSMYCNSEKGVFIADWHLRYSQGLAMAKACTRFEFLNLYSLATCPYTVA